MSGLLLTTGLDPERNHEELGRMADAAPLRGELDMVSLPGASLAVMRRSWGAGSSASGLVVDDGRAVISVGSIYLDSARLSGDEAAARLLEIYAANEQRLLGVRGTCTFVLFDSVCCEILAVRDALGRRPLFFTSSNGAVRIASEAKQLLAADARLRRLDLAGIRQAVTLRLSDPMRTAYAPIKRLGGGMALCAKGRRVTTRRWWRPPHPGSAAVSVGRASRRLHEALVRAVQREADPPAGVLLSGGLDSSAVAAAAVAASRQHGHLPPCAISATYPSFPRLDESQYFGAAARHLGMQLHTVEPAPRPFRSVEEEARRHDGPATGSFASNFRALLVKGRRVGCRVLLDGHDGDSLLGRTNYVVPALLRRGAWAAAWHYLVKWHARSSIGWPWLLVRQAIELLGPTAGEQLRRLRRTLGPEQSPAWARVDVRGFAPALIGPPVRSWDEAQQDVTAGWTWLALEFLEREALAAGVDLLHPFFDQDVVELALSLPPEIKITGGLPKGVLRSAFCEQLPRIVVERTDKAAFNSFYCACCPPPDVRDAVKRSQLAGSLIAGAELDAMLTAGATYGELVLLVALLQVARLLESVG